MTSAAGKRASERLLLVVSDAITADVLMRGQLGLLREEGFEVALVASPGRRLEEVATREGIEVVGVNIERAIAPISDLFSLLELSRAIRRLRPRLVNASTPKGGLLGMLAARLAGVPVRVYTVRGLRLETTSGWRRRLLTASERLAVASAHQVIAVSESLRRKMISLRLCPDSKITVLGAGSSGGVDTNRFLPASRRTGAGDRLRARLGLSSDELVIGFVGRFTHDKGLADLAAAFSTEIRPRMSNASLLLVGEDDPTDRLPRDLTARLRQDSRVVFAGFVERPEDYYPLMDVLAFPSYREGFPNAPLEAAACEIPVAGYAATGTTDAVLDGTTGTLVPVGQVSSLAGAICEYLEDPDLRRRHGKAARRRVVAEFGREKVARAWAAEYRRLIDDGP